MTLKTGRKCKWEEIEVGELFCWSRAVILKLGHYETRWVSTSDDEFYCEGELSYGFNESHWKLYKLPLSTQHLWKEE